MILRSSSSLFDYVSLVDISFYMNYNINQSTECGNKIWVTSIIKKISDCRHESVHLPKAFSTFEQHFLGEKNSNLQTRQ